MANIAAMGDAAQSVEQGISGAFTCVESCMKSTLEMKHLIENEANKEADENAKKEQFVSAAMAQLKELAGTHFNIIIVRDYQGDTKGFDEADPPMPLIKVEYSPGKTADYRIYLFTKGDYQRPEGPRWEESDIQWWPHDGTTVYKPTGIIVDEVMKLTFSQRPGMTRAEREAKQNSLTLDKAVRDANTRITAEQAEEIKNSDNPEQTKKDIEARNAAVKAGLTNGATDEDEVQPDEDEADPDAEDTPEQDDGQSAEHVDQISAPDVNADASEDQNAVDDDQKSDAKFGKNQPGGDGDAQGDEDTSQNEGQNETVDEQNLDSGNDATDQDNDQTPQPENDAQPEEDAQNQDQEPPPDAEEAPEAPEPEEAESEEPVPDEREAEDPAPEEPEAEEPEPEEASPEETEKPEEEEADANPEGGEEDGEEATHQ